MKLLKTRNQILRLNGKLIAVINNLMRPCILMEFSKKIKISNLSLYLNIKINRNIKIDGYK